MNKIKFFIAAALTLVLVSCGKNKDENLWIVGTSADNPPYEFIKDGQVAGFDIDLINYIAKHLGKKVEFKNMEFHGLLAALTNKDIDLVIAGFSVTDERQKRVNFSIPYTTATVAVLYRREDSFREYNDLYKRKVGAQLGTIFSLIAHELAVKCNCQITSLASNLMLVEELKSKRLDAVILEESQAEKFSQVYPYLTRFTVPQFSSSFAIAMPKDSQLKKNIDHTIKALKSNGTINALEKRWGLIGGN